MKIIKSVTAFRDKNNRAEVLNNNENFCKVRVSNNFNMNNIIRVMGTANRKPLKNRDTVFNMVDKNDENYFELVQKNWSTEDFHKLRAPHKFRRNKSHTENKLMDKTCEILFQYLKPHQHLSSNNKMKILQSKESVRSILKTNNFSYERKATRTVQFLSICEGSHMSHTFNNGYDLLTKFENGSTDNYEEISFMNADTTEISDLNIEMETESIKKTKLSPKTISSEDFIEDVFSSKL